MLTELQKEHGNLIRLWAPGRSMVFVMDPEDASTIYKHEGKQPYKPAMGAFGYYRYRRPDLYKGNGNGNVLVASLEL